jgi:hypothetical protein
MHDNDIDIAKYADRVARGIELLDSHIPGWADRIDLSRLDIQSCVSCVLGQLGGWAHTSDLLDIYGDQTRYGFESPFGDRGVGGYRVLNDLWADEIRRRQSS